MYYILLDPSLTVKNLTEIFETIPAKEWDDAGRRFRIPESERQMIRSTHRTDDQRKKSILDSYVNKHPCPSWAHVTRILRGMQFPELAKEVTKKYMSGKQVTIISG